MRGPGWPKRAYDSAVTAFRRIAPLVSFLLLALVSVQVADLLVGTDEARAQQTPCSAPAGHESGSHSDSGGKEPGSFLGLTDSLFHVFWTRTECLPVVAGTPVAAPAPYAPFVAHLTSVPLPPVDHVPLPRG